MGNDQIFSLADKLRQLRDRKAELEDELKALTAEIDATDKALSDALAQGVVVLHLLGCHADTECQHT